MDLGAIERSLRESVSASVVADPRLLRRVIKAHRHLPGLGLAVPHSRSYAIARAELLAIVDVTELAALGANLPEEVILLARPALSDLTTRTSADVLARLWRAAFHEEVHLAIQRRKASGALDAAAIRARIDRIGQSEFDEVRGILRHDDRLLPPADDHETFAELAALWLELRHFAPSLLRSTFPGLVDAGLVDAVLDAEVDANALLERACPTGADRSKTVPRTPASPTTSPSFSEPATLGALDRGKARIPSAGDVTRLSRAADEAAVRGNAVRAALLRGAAIAGETSERSDALRREIHIDLDALARRLGAALRAPDEAVPSREEAAWTPSLVVLAERAAQSRGLRYPIEARLLYDLQRAATLFEQTSREVDVVTWALSLGKVPVARPLPATREIRVARALREAAAKVRHVRVPAPERRLLARLLRWASERADQNARAALRPRFLRVLSGVGLRPENVPERVARDKLVEELLDLVVVRGQISIAALRDAFSRNQLKQGDLRSASELFRADPLLETDRLLARAMGGVYRRGEIYLRALQKLSSIAFGTRPGRLFTVYLAIPLGGAFIVLEALGHLVSPIARLFHYGPIHLLDVPSFVGTSLALVALIHSEGVRRAAKRAIAIVGVVLSALLLRAPRWVFTRPVLRRLFARPRFRALLRRVVVPLGVSAAAWAFTPLGDAGAPVVVAGSIAVFIATSMLLASRVALFIEDAFFDWIAPTWRSFSERVFPGLLRLVTGTFRALVDLLERGIYRVDEWLRFRDGEGRATIASKAVFGVLWFVVAYVIRLYVTIFVEPELNPVKHFPVIMVAHKLMIPFASDVLDALQSAFSPLGRILGGTIAATTAFFLPSASGFLVWELKENWKLYRENRPDALEPSIIGSHGETLSAILVPGFHAGTIPKLFDRRRRAAQRDDARRREDPDESGPASMRTEGSGGAFREGVEAIEDAIRRFVDRELCGLFRRSRRWTLGPIDVTRVEIAPNRVRIHLVCAALTASACAILVEEQSGLLVASIAEPGFLDRLPNAPNDARRLFENALAGFYHLAAIDLVREPIEAALGANTPYDVADEGLVVWPGEGYRTEAVYPLRAPLDGYMIEPIVRGEPAPRPLPLLDVRQILFRNNAIRWADWVQAWGAADRASGEIPRLLRGPSILSMAPAIALEA